MKVRIKFKKYGVMKFIGHLDLMRYFQKAVRRANIPVAYSGGFSPHQIMSFAAPLGVGLESNAEYMDLELREDADCAALCAALNQTMAEGVEIVSVRPLGQKAQNAMAGVAAAEYSVRFRDGYAPEFDWQSQLMDFYAQTTIPVKKQTKKGEREFDLKSSVYELDVQGDVIHMLVDACSGGNIKPGFVWAAFCLANGMEEPSPFALMITREELYGRKEQDGESRLVPLEELGADG